MDCNKCKGSGIRIIQNTISAKKTEYKCYNCNGSGKLSEEQEHEYKIMHMKFHEEINRGNELYILRVAGGWLYQHYDTIGELVTSSTFVPDPSE